MFFMLRYILKKRLMLVNIDIHLCGRLNLWSTYLKKKMYHIYSIYVLYKIPLSQAIKLIHSLTHFPRPNVFTCLAQNLLALASGRMLVSLTVHDREPTIREKSGKSWKMWKKSPWYGKIMEFHFLGKIMEKSWKFEFRKRKFVSICTSMPVLPYRPWLN